MIGKKRPIINIIAKIKAYPANILGHVLNPDFAKYNKPRSIRRIETKPTIMMKMTLLKILKNQNGAQINKIRSNNTAHVCSAFMF